MAMKSIIIELKYDYNKDDEREKIILDAARTTAKQLFTTAVMMGGKRRPEIAMHSDDFFMGTQEINLDDDIPATAD